MMMRKLTKKNLKLTKWQLLALTLLLIAFALMLVSLLITLIAPDVGHGFYSMIERRAATRVMLIAITAALLVLMGLYVRDLLAPRRGSVPASAEEALKLDAEGTVSVSSQAMESLVNQTVGHIEGVASYETRVNGDTEFLTVDIYLTVMSGTRVPELSESLKKALAEELESLAGVKKTEVHLLISDVVKMKLQ